MELRSDILYRLAVFWERLPPDTLGVAVLFALEYPELVAGFLSGVAVGLYGCISDLLSMGLSSLLYVGRGLIETIVVGWVLKMLEVHAWPKLPPDVQKMLLRVADLALLRQPTRDRPSPRKDESAFSRNRNRHPHW